MTVEQRLETEELLRETKDSLKGILKTKWDRLLWEPTYQLGGEDPQIHGLRLPKIQQTINDWSSWSAPDLSVYYVTPDGSIHRQTRSRVDYDKYQTFEHGEIDFIKYLSLAPIAEVTLNNLRTEQEQEIKVNPEGRDVIWRRGSRLFNLEYLGLVSLGYAPRGSMLYKEGDSDRCLVRAKFRDNKFALFCPEHTNSELVHIIEDDLSDDEAADVWSKHFLKCPIDDNHLSIPVVIDDRLEITRYQV